MDIVKVVQTVRVTNMVKVKVANVARVPHIDRVVEQSELFQFPVRKCSPELI